MKITVIGVGAMGSIYAALLADDGHQVHAVDPWQAHIDAINAHGLRVEGASGVRCVTTIKATSSLRADDSCDLCIIATKAADVGAAARQAAILVNADNADAYVLTIQNGLGSTEQIAPYIALDKVLLGVAEGFGASMRGPGHAHHNAMKQIRLGEINGGLTPRLHHLETMFCQAGLAAAAYADLDRLIWEKFICNVTFSAPCTVFDKTIGALMANPELWAIALGAMQEAYALAKARSIILGFSDPIAYVTDFGANMPAANPSMLLDHKARRRSELDAINGKVTAMGRELGIPTPYNDTLVAVLRQREENFDKSS